MSEIIAKIMLFAAYASILGSTFGAHGDTVARREALTKW
jgi:hypothetical protein